MIELVAISLAISTVVTLRACYVVGVQNGAKRERDRIEGIARAYMHNTRKYSYTTWQVLGIAFGDRKMPIGEDDA